MTKRIFKPLVLETKSQLLAAMRSGKLSCTKYNTLDQNERLFVEMLVFGDYSAEQAMRAIKPKIKDARAAANRLMANPAVSETIEELSIQKDKSFMAELSSVRTMALSKLKYLMNSAKEESIQAACAKTILDKAEKIILESGKKQLDEGYDGVKFSIECVNVNLPPEPRYNPNDAIYVDVEVESEKQEEEYIEAKLATKSDVGLSYTLDYSNYDNYNSSDDD